MSLLETVFLRLRQVSGSIGQVFSTVRSVSKVEGVVEPADAMSERGERISLEFVGNTVLRAYRHTTVCEIKTYAAYRHDERGKGEVAGDQRLFSGGFKKILRRFKKVAELWRGQGLLEAL